MALATHFYHGTPIADWKNVYKKEPPKDLATAPIDTKLPKQSDNIRATATFLFGVIAGGALGLYLAFKVRNRKLQQAIFTSGLFVGVVGSGYFLVRNEKAEDLLVRQINQISGKNIDPYTKKIITASRLPAIDLQQVPEEKLQTTLARLDWNVLPAASTASTLDGRTVLIVKAKDRTTNKASLRVFVEKIGPRDFNHKLPIPEWIFDVLNAIYGFRHEREIPKEGLPSIVMTGSMSPAMAAEFSLQQGNVNVASHLLNSSFGSRR